MKLHHCHPHTSFHYVWCESDQPVSMSARKLVRTLVNWKTCSIALTIETPCWSVSASDNFTKSDNEFCTHAAGQLCHWKEDNLRVCCALMLRTLRRPLSGEEESTWRLSRKEERTRWQSRRPLSRQEESAWWPSRKYLKVAWEKRNCICEQKRKLFVDG